MAVEPKRPTLSLGTPDVTPPADPAMSVQGQAVSKEEFEELKSQNEDLQEQNTRLHADFEALMAEIRSARRAPDAHLRDPMKTNAEPIDGETPIFKEDEPHGVVTGDSEVGYVQHGHQFGRDKEYIATEPNRGTGRPFNPRLVGVVRKPKAVDIN